jgi:hypothetical protein
MHSTDGLQREITKKNFPIKFTVLSLTRLKWLTHFHKNNFLIFCRFSIVSKEEKCKTSGEERRKDKQQLVVLPKR